MSRFVAHGQNWEDVRLRRIFADQPSGFYIDVGAGHPSFHSFSYFLYKQGWRGVSVEPLPSFFALLEEERPSDINLQAVLGQNGDGGVVFFEVPEMRGSSTMRADVASELVEQGLSVIEHEIPLLTLQAICERYAPATIDLLKVDVEGAEADVLMGGDWQRHRPRLVVVEANATESWEPLLLGSEYLHAAFDGVNHWYVEAAEAQWIELLEPPVSVLDNFVPFELLGMAETDEPSAAVNASVSDAGAEGLGMPQAGGWSKPSLLLVLSSSNQLYSGTGRVIFETLGLLVDRFAIEVSIDEIDPRNVGLARAFCSAHGLPLHLGAPRTLAGAPDSGNGALGELLQERRWDIVMGVSWANAATNDMLLADLDDRVALAYLPLHQPTWTVPLDELGRSVVESTHRAMLRRADVVLCLTPWERHALMEILTPELPSCAVVPPGCDFSSFIPGSVERPNDLLFVGDHREPRKRFDRVAAVLERVRASGHDARLVVIGNESERAAEALSPALGEAVLALGYVGEERLRQAYREAAVLMLLSEYEAFGLPVVEALACATPVVMTRQPAPESLFGGNSGVSFVDGDDIDGAAEAVCRILGEGNALRQQLIAGRAELAREYDWPACARHTRDHLLAAWARRCRAHGGFIPVSISR